MLFCSNKITRFSFLFHILMLIFKFLVVMWVTLGVQQNSAELVSRVRAMVARVTKKLVDAWNAEVILRAGSAIDARRLITEIH